MKEQKTTETTLVDRLKVNLEKLLDKYDKIIEKIDEKDPNINKKGIETLRLIKSTKELIDQLDYNVQYSAYTIKIEGEPQKVLSLWEQNSDGQIRNHRIWKIENELELGTLRPIVKL